MQMVGVVLSDRAKFIVIYACKPPIMSILGFSGCLLINALQTVDVRGVLLLWQREGRPTVPGSSYARERVRRVGWLISYFALRYYTAVNESINS
jgi:hypothetical protein